MGDQMKTDNVYKKRGNHRIMAAVLICILAVSTFLTGCGEGASTAGSRTDGASSSVEDVLAQGMAEADAEAGEDDEANPYSVSGSDSDQNLVLTPTPYDFGDENADDTAEVEEITDPAETERLEREALAAGTEGIDIDLTLLSSTMVYSQVYDMMMYPENYVGKTVRMSGVYTDFYDEAADKHYFACIIQDATACCAQGIEFELTDDYKYPEDYPEDSDLITVTGVFDTYMEGEAMYVTLRNARKG